MTRQSVTLGTVALALAITAQTLHATTVDIILERDGGLHRVERVVPDGLTELEAAVYGLVNGPTAQEFAEGYTSSIPTNVFVVSLSAIGDTVTVDLSSEILAGLDDASLGHIFDQFRATLGDFAWVLSIRLTCQDQLLASYIDRAIVDSPAPLPTRIATMESAPTEPAPMGLAGRVVTVGPSHGRFWNGTGWYWQRVDPCGLGEAVLEDTNSIRLVQFLHQYLTQDGATVHSHRQLDETECCHGDTGLPWWKMATYAWLRHLGMPCSMYANSSGICDSDVGSVTRLTDDIRAHALFADYTVSDIYIAHHTNGAAGTGTETFRDTTMLNPAHVTNSYTLALAVNNGIVDAIRDMYDASWANRGVKDAQGAYYEINAPNRPTCLVELAFHDRCDKDAIYLTDNFFRSVSEWGVYNGVCSYFGTTPTWGKYSCEYVSDTIPSTMETGYSYPVSITFRNRGVVWSDIRDFRLGAVGDSDPFADFTRVNVAGEIRPGDTFTFNFTLRAPGAPGTYTTEWQMVRDGSAWFGPMHSESIDVTAGTPFDDALLVSEDIPDVVTPGETTDVHLTFRNYGTTTWTVPDNFKLGAVGDSDPFAATRHELGTGVTVPPDTNHTFTVTFTAPMTEDTYTTDWQMIHEGTGWFGEVLIKQVEVAQPDNAELISEDIPTDMLPGQMVEVQLTFRNNGTTTWTYAGDFELGAIGDSDPFAATRHALPVDDSVLPGQQRTFTVTFTAPTTVGTYTTDWQMVRDPNRWFGDTVTRQIKVANSAMTVFFDDFDSYANQAAFETVWIDNGTTECVLDTTFGNDEQSVRMPSPSANYLGRFYTNLDKSYNPSDNEPLVFAFDLHLPTSGGPGWSGARHFCEFRGYSGGSYDNGTMQNLLAIGVNNSSNDTFNTTKYQGRVTNGVNWVTLDEGSAPSRMAGWHRMKIEILSNQIRFYVDDILSETEARPNAYGFDCIVLDSNLTSNGYTSYVDNVEVTVYAAVPVINQHPTAQAACEGDSAQYSVAAVGGTLSYHWQKNGVNLSDGGHYSGVLTAQLTVSNADAGDVADYRCVVTNSSGSTTSNTAALSLKAETAITLQPQSQQVARGGTATFTVTGTGAGTLAYQWQKNGDDMPGEQLDTLEIAGCGNSDVANYRCIVTGDCGSVTSDEAALTLPPPGDFDLDGDVDLTDFGVFAGCFNGPNRAPAAPDCEPADMDSDSDVDLTDFGVFSSCFNGPNRAPACP